MKQGNFLKIGLILFILLGALGMVFFTTSLVAQSAGTPSTAAHSVYNDDWQTGDDDASPMFSAWTLYTTNAANAGWFIGSSTNNGDGDSNSDGDINTSGKAWGLWANSGQTSGAARTFTALSAGQTLSFKIDNGWVDSGGTVGFHLQNASQQIVLEMYFVGGATNYMFKEAGSSAVSTGLGFTDEGLTVSLDIGASNAYTFTLTRLAGGTYTKTGTLPNPGSGASISRVYFYNAFAGPGSQRDYFINSMLISYPPDAKDDAFSTYEDAAVNGDLKADNGNGADSDPDSTSLTTSLATAPAKGIANVNSDGTFSFDPNGEFDYLNAGETEDVSFTYTLQDDEGRKDTATVTITVEGVSPTTVTPSVDPEPSLAGVEALLKADVNEDAEYFCRACRTGIERAIGPTGVVTFTVNGSEVGSSSLTSGTATYSYTFATEGDYEVCAEFSSDSDEYYDSGPTCTTHLVQKETQITNVYAYPEPSIAGNPFDLYAQVSTGELFARGILDFPLPTLGGMVEFTNWLYGSLGSAPIDDSGEAVLQDVTFYDFGTYEICATFTPDSDYYLAPEDPECFDHVVKAQTDITVTVTPEPSLVGEETLFEALVTYDYPEVRSEMDIPQPTGVVTFTVDGAEVATSTLSGGIATFSYTFSTDGIFEVCAEYGAEETGYFLDSGPACTDHVVEKPVIPVLYVSSDISGIVGGVAFDDEDVLMFDGTNWSMYFDGSDVGLSLADLDAFAFLPNGDLILSLDIDLTVSGAGKVADEDLIRFIPTTLGPSTAGTFVLYFDGSDVALTTTSEDIDAVHVMADGSLLISTWGDYSVTGVTGMDEDLLLFRPTELGLTTRGTWSMFFDGSDVGLTLTVEDTNGSWYDGAGNLYLTTEGNFSVTGVSGEGRDIFVCNLTSTGLNTACTFNPNLYFDGSTHGFPGVIDAMAIRVEEVNPLVRSQFSTDQSTTSQALPSARPGIPWF